MEHGFEHAPLRFDQHRPKFEEIPPTLPLSDPRVQVLLAKAAYPDAEHPGMQWIEKEDGVSLSDRFGGYRDEIGRETTIETSPEGMATLLQAVRMHEADHYDEEVAPNEAHRLAEAEKRRLEKEGETLH